MKIRTRAAAILAAAATALLAVPGTAHAGSTLAFNDGTQSVGLVENSRSYTLPAGRTSRGWLGLTDVDTVVLRSGQCGQISVDYGPWQLLRATRTGISAGATAVHVKTFTC